MFSAGARAPGLMPVAAADARAWAVTSAEAAVRVPAEHAEAAAWTVRGWADVAVGCLALDGPAIAAAPGSRRDPGSSPGAFGGLDAAVRAAPVVSGGQHAARLRRLRELAGPVPPWYPDTRPAAGPIRRVRRLVWQAADLLTRFGNELMMAGARLPWSAS